jgi:Tfp pilus assembly protein PilF
MNHLKDAMRHLLLAVVQSPGNSILQKNLALALIWISENNFVEAMGFCTKVIECMPQHPDVLTTRAEISLVRKRWEEARVDPEKAMLIGPGTRSSGKCSLKSTMRCGRRH